MEKTFITAMKRELFEETSIKNFKIIKEVENMYEYELPENLVELFGKVNLEAKSKNGLLIDF